MAMIGEDCYFYYNSTCARGDSCTYRHQPAARSTTEICQNWLKGSCFKPSCTLRHIVASFQSSTSGDQSKMQCYWERQPSGCLKQNCPYFHSLRNSPLPVGSPAVAAMSAVLPPSIGIASHLPAVQLSGSPFVAVGQPLPGNGLNVSAPGAIFIGRGLTVVNHPSPLIGGPALLRGPVPNLTASLLQSTSVSAPSSEVPAPAELTVNESTASLRKDFEKVVPRGATIHIKPSIARLMAPQTQQGQGYAPVLGPPPNTIGENVLPGIKQEHFGEQVRLFKEMLAGKSPISAVAKPSELTMNSKERFSPVEHDLSDEWSDVDNKELSRGKRHDDARRLESQREKSRKRKRDRRGQDRSSSSLHRKAFSRSSGRVTLSKADQELLEGDYKDVPLHSDRKSIRRKRATSAAHSDGELDLHVKPLEQVLREKAIRRMAERDGSKEVRDSGEVTSDRLPASDDDIQRAGRRGRSSKRSTKSATVDSEIATPVQPPHGDDVKADILCDGAPSESNEKLGVARPTAESVGVSSEDSATKQEESNTTPHAGEAGVSEDAELAYASDGTDVSLDVPDEEIESLHMPVNLKSVPITVKQHGDAATKSRRSSKAKSRSVRKPSASFDNLGNKKRASGASFAYRDVAASYERSTKNRRRFDSSDDRRDRLSNPQSAQVKADKKARLLTGQPLFDKKRSSLENVVAVKQTLTLEDVGNAVVATSANEGKSLAKESCYETDSVETPGRPAVPVLPQQKLAEISTAASKVHVKSFEEIMAEKRRRKFGAPEVHVISDDGDCCDPVVKPAFGGTAKKVMATFANLRSKSEATKATVLSKPVAALPSPRSDAQTAARSSDSDAKTVAEKRIKVARKSIQLYKPPVKEGAATMASSSVGDGSTPDVILNGSHPSSRLPLSSSSSKTSARENVSIANSARLVKIRRPSSDSAPVVNKVNVKSFADIMQEKRLRRQHPSADASVVAQESSSFSLRRHRFLKKPTDRSASTSDPSPERLDSAKLVASQLSNVARVSPFNKSDASELCKSDTAPLVKQSRLEVAIGDDNSFSLGADADSSFKASVKDAKPSLARLPVADGELSRLALAKDAVAPRLSQTLNYTERPHPVERRFGSVSHSGVVAVSTDQPPLPSLCSENAGAKNVKESVTTSPDVNDSASNCSFKDIQQALESKRRQREEDILSDEELKKEFDDLSSAGEDDMDEDDLMMEIEDMIGDD